MDFPPPPRRVKKTKFFFFKIAPLVTNDSGFIFNGKLTMRTSSSRFLCFTFPSIPRRYVYILLIPSWPIPPFQGINRGLQCIGTYYYNINSTGVFVFLLPYPVETILVRVFWANSTTFRLNTAAARILNHYHHLHRVWWMSSAETPLLPEYNDAVKLFIKRT